MALPLLDGLQPELVYDCIDALDAFLHAPPELRLREEALLHRADGVFTGGPSLYKRLQGRHSNVYCFPSSVDARHFAQAQNVIAEPTQAASLVPDANCQKRINMAMSWLHCRPESRGSYCQLLTGRQKVVR